MSSSLGLDPSSVQIHDDPEAAELARQHNARALTVGTHIAFGSGEYRPGTAVGDAILAHELAHAAQQQGPGGNLSSEASLESDATQAAIGAFGSLRGDLAAAPAARHQSARPSIRSGLRLARCGKDKEAERKASLVLTYIQNEAKQRAANPPSLDPASNFYTRLKDVYLADYLQNPTAARGREAVDAIGRPMEGRPNAVDPSRVDVRPQGGAWRPAGDRWEQNAIQAWNDQPVEMPDQIRSLPLFSNIATLPPRLEAATDLLIKENVDELPYVDSPFLLGQPNLRTTQDFNADWKFGGQNISQLMHWGTGVKYADESADAMHELFLAYEMWHLEGWDVFGQDALNDMIAEEQGRILGQELLKGSAGAIQGESDLLPFLNRSFLQSRAWVGALLRLRRGELDKWILAEEQPKANIWYQEKADIWSTETVYAMLAGGASMDDVKASDLVEAQIQIYTLIYEAELWEASEGPITLTPLQRALVEGKLNSILALMAKGPNATSGDKLNAYTNLNDLKGGS